MRVLMYPNTQAHAGERASLAEYSSKNMDHLGIVVMICREIDLAGEIDRIVGVDPRQKVTCGEAVVAMVLNALGFVDRPLYLFPEFMATKPVELLIGEGLKVEWFNDDVLGRTLDKLYSKDGRPDLKQFVISLVMSDSLPVFIRALSGNTSDKSHFREIVKAYEKSLQEMWGKDKIWVWDSAGYTEQTIKEK